MAAIAPAAIRPSASAGEPEYQPGDERSGKCRRRADSSVPALSRSSILNNARVDLTLNGRGSWGSLKRHAMC
jgi:hypothetical protein